MKTVLCKAFGEPSGLVVEEVDPPPVGRGDVRIRVRAAGVNFPDLLMIRGQYQVKPPLPFAPGPETAGEVLEVGPEVEGIAPGDRVMATHPWGGYAEQVVTRAAAVTPIGESLSYVEAAAFQLTYGTSYHALVDRAGLAPGETLLVTGASGGVGLTAVELGKVLGATVIAAAGGADKLEVAKRYGADHVIDYRSEGLRDRVKELTGGRGVDVVYDPVGGDVFDQAVRCMEWNGRFLIIGFAAGRIPEFRTNLALIKGFSLVGVYWGSFAARDPERNRANFAALMRWHAEGKVRPLVSATYPLARASEALVALAERRSVGKLVITMDEGRGAGA